MLGGQVCYLPSKQECFIIPKAFLPIGQVTNLPSQHFKQKFTKIHKNN